MASTGYLTGTGFSSIDLFAEGQAAWTNVADAETNNSVNATGVCTGGGANGQVISAAFDFSAVASDAVLTGIRMRGRGRKAAGSADNGALAPLWHAAVGGGAGLGSDIAIFTSTSYANFTIGADGDLWGFDPGTTFADLAGYDIEFGLYCGGYNCTLDLDYFQVELFYVAPIPWVGKPDYRSQGSFASGTGNVTPTNPSSGVTGELLLWFASSANENVATPSGQGMTDVGGDGTGTAAATAAVRIEAWAKIRGASESNKTFVDPGNHCAAVCIALSNPHPTIATAIHQVATAVDATSDTSGTVPEVTTTIDGCYILYVIANSADTTTGQLSSYTHSSGAVVELETIFDDNTSSGNGSGFTIVGGKQATAGATGTLAVTLSAASLKAMITIAIAPDSAAAIIDDVLNVIMPLGL